MKKKIYSMFCGMFGHRWEYFFKIELPDNDRSVCRRCGCIKKYVRKIPEVNSVKFKRLGY